MVLPGSAADPAAWFAVVEVLLPGKSRPPLLGQCSDSSRPKFGIGASEAGRNGYTLIVLGLAPGEPSGEQSRAIHGARMRDAPKKT